MTNYCYTCMNEIAQGGYCPHCERANIADDTVYRLRPGTILNKKFLVGNCLGEGGFGITYIGRDLTLDRKVAIKEYFPSGYVNRNSEQFVSAATEEKRSFFIRGLQNFLEEARKIARLTDVPGIVDVREYFEENGTAYIIMEYLYGIDLSAYLTTNGFFRPEKLFSLMLPITYSLQKIHEQGIIHRDISPDNIMYLKNGTLRLMDFGSAKYFANQEREMSVVLKQGYAPAEQYSKNGEQGPWTDVYSLCATMYRCITGRVPPDAIDRIRYDSLIPPSQLGVKIPEAMENILLYGLAVSHTDRCQSMRELSYLMEQALAGQNIRIQNPGFYPHAPAGMAYRVQQPPQNRYPAYPQEEEYREPYEKSSKAPIIIAIAIFLCVTIIAGSVIYLYLQSGSVPSPIVAADSTAASVSSTENGFVPPQTDAPTEETSGQDPYITIPATQAPTSPTTPVTPADPMSTFISGVDAMSTRESMGDKSYTADNVLTKDDTCWCPTEGTGTGQWIQLNLSHKAGVSGLEIINGYAGTEEQYSNNRKVTRIRIEFSDGSSAERSLIVYDNAHRKTVQTVAFDRVVTGYIKITILDVREADGANACKDTCITYISPVT